MTSTTHPYPVPARERCADCGTVLVGDGVWPMLDGRVTCFECCNKDLAHFDFEKQAQSGGVDVTDELGGHAVILERLFNDPREFEEIEASGDMAKWKAELKL